MAKKKTNGRNVENKTYGRERSRIRGEISLFSKKKGVYKGHGDNKVLFRLSQ